MSALVKRENGRWMSRDLELGLEGSREVERHLTGVHCVQTCEPGFGDTFKRKSSPTVHERRAHETANHFKADSAKVDRNNPDLMPREMQRAESQV